MRKFSRVSFVAGAAPREAGEASVDEEADMIVGREGLGCFLTHDREDRTIFSSAHDRSGREDFCLGTIEGIGRDRDFFCFDNR
jgi:hypothetical protein